MQVFVFAWVGELADRLVEMGCGVLTAGKGTGLALLAGSAMIVWSPLLAQQEPPEYVPYADGAQPQQPQFESDASTVMEDLPAVPQAFGMRVPTRVEHLQEMQDYQRQLAQRAAQATVALAVQGPRGAVGSGSGVLISPEGLIATAQHVAARAGMPVKVILADGREFDGVCLLGEESADGGYVMILPGQLEQDLPFVELATERAQPGDWVMGVGNSGQWDPQRGNVVRMGRVVMFDSRKGALLTDLTMIGGDSGGPLLNMQGELVGVNRAIGGMATSTLHSYLPWFWLTVGWAQQDMAHVQQHGVEAYLEYLGEGNGLARAHEMRAELMQAAESE